MEPFLPRTRLASIHQVWRSWSSFPKGLYSEEQLTSYEAQVDYYTRFIRSNPDWEFVDVYTDEGISTLNTKHRDGFNRMIEDALAGKINLIVTKSVSRFARNTVDSLSTIRLLKEHGVEVFFEKEAIWTFDGRGELLLTIMSSLAQEESRSISENVTMPYSSFLDYRKGADGLPEIVPEEASIVRQIYTLFMQGKTLNWIAKHLTEQGHPAIIDPDQWEKVQTEMAVRKSKGRYHNSLSPFSAKIVCGDCGEYYGPKIWHSTDKYRRVIWQCNGKFKGEHRCSTPHLYEEDIKCLFLQAVADLTEAREVLMETCQMLLDEYLNTESLDAESAALETEMGTD